MTKLEEEIFRAINCWSIPPSMINEEVNQELIAEAKRAAEVAERYARAKWAEACEAQKQEIVDNGLIALMKRSPEFKP